MSKAICLLLAISVAGVAVADGNAVVQRQLNANYAAISKAFQRHDASKIEALLANDYLVVQANGQSLPRDHALQALRWQMKAMQGANWSRKVRSVMVSGKKAIAIVDGDFSGTMVAPDGKRHRMRLVSTSKDTWVRSRNGYLLSRSNVQKSVATMDGRRMSSASPRS